MHRKAYFTFILACLLLLNLQTAAQFEGVGNIISWKKTPEGLKGKTRSAFFRVRVYNANVIRVTVSRNDSNHDFSYVLSENLKPELQNFKISENKNSVLISTDSLDVVLEKFPEFRVIFKNKSGKIINEDMPGAAFGSAFDGNKSNLYKVIQPGERFVGLGETLGNLDKRGSAFTLNNTDTYRYGDSRLPMYVSIPFYIGIQNRETYGIFYHNTFRTFFNFGISTPFASITADGGDVDYFFIYGDGIPEILKQYTALTGRMPLPPKWSLGYHQSRCSYFPQQNVEWLSETFRSRQIPIDCIVLDADYLHEYEPFRINKERFPDMPALTRHLADLGIEVTASVNPGIKLDTTYFAHNDGLKNDIFVKYADGSLFTSEIAPSLNNFPDFTSPNARNWWSDNMKFLPENGIHGYWNDMNEPAVGGSYLPENLLFDFDGRKAFAPEAKNLYGMLMARSSYESAIKYGGNRRPFVLSRSGFAGIQRYAAVWTGDNTAKDDYLLGGALLNTQMGLSGVPFVGDDIGGYIGNTSKELFTRWIEVGAFEPFCRNHKEAYANANEPWSYGEEAEAIAREYIGFRYRLMPYLYSKFYEASQTGMPVARSLCISNPHNDKVFDALYQFQFLCGDAIMVVPVTTAEKTKKFYLPEGLWYDLFTDETFPGNQELTVDCPIYKIPLFVKESSVIVMQSLVQSAKQKPGDTLFVHVYKGSQPNVFEYYEDDGNTLNYQRNEFCKRTVTYNPALKQVVFSAQSGSYASTFKVIKCILHGFGSDLRQVNINNRSFTTNLETIRLIDGLKYLEGIYDPAYFMNLRQSEMAGKQLTFSFANTEQEIEINW
ncbi:MAG TPA: glycoside hydrolase family 31 protein [Bacteroidales bacterium]|nr:glycoside hydrolase family 31 protein [Bacteroidales bacterium]